MGTLCPGRDAAVDFFIILSEPRIKFYSNPFYGANKTHENHNKHTHKSAALDTTRGEGEGVVFFFCSFRRTDPLS